MLSSSGTPASSRAERDSPCVGTSCWLCRDAVLDCVAHLEFRMMCSIDLSVLYRTLCATVINCLIYVTFFFLVSPAWFQA